MIRIQPLQNEDPGLMGPYWSLTVHDNHYGKISNLCSSFDDRFLFSVGMDGNFFMFEMMSDLKLEQAATAAARAKIPSAKVCIQVLSSASSYSACTYLNFLTLL